MQDHWLLTAPPGSGASGHRKSTGWMPTENFIDYMKHFKLHAKPSAEQPILLILDNHSSHIAIEILDYAKENHISVCAV